MLFLRGSGNVWLKEPARYKARVAGYATRDGAEPPGPSASQWFGIAEQPEDRGWFNLSLGSVDGVLEMRATNSRRFGGLSRRGPTLAAVLLFAAVELAGCGAGQKAGASRDPQRVAGEFGLFYAKLAANQDHPATEAQVEALARELAPVCSPPRNGQYRCVVHLLGQVPSTQQCVAVMASAGQVKGRCSAGTAPAPVVATGYVNCASIGRVAPVADPAGDEKRVVPLLRSERLVPTSEPHADLTQVRVAATLTRFCADFETRAPLTPGSWLGLNISQNGAPDHLFAPTVSYRQPPSPELQSPVNDPIAGRIGTSGDWTSLLIAAGDPGAPLPHTPFRFQAYANYEIAAPGQTRMATDSAPDSPRYATYP